MSRENQNHKNSKHGSLLAILALALVSWLAFPAVGHAQTGSYNGLMLQAQNMSAFTVPPGRTFTDVNQFDPRNIPADGLSNYTVVYRAFVYATAGASATTCVVGITEGPVGAKTVYSPAVTVPPYTTVQIPFEVVTKAHAGDLIQGSSTMSAGSQGGFTIGYFSSLTLLAYPTP
ncbi:MAG TPA: hypothetical protein VKB84_02975 [Candidatus Binataceae bacterium]|nr:hypothetical protein [Candidatus Binataceae bacterium]